MNAGEFTPDAPGRLVTAIQAGSSYRAFIPNPLPPAVSLDDELILLLSDADRALGELAGLGRSMSNPHLLIGPFIRREAVLSSRIEGTRTSLAELYSYEARRRRQSESVGDEALSDAREVLNYVHALEQGVALIEQSPINRDLLCRLHERLMQNVRGNQAHPGCLRDCQVYIGSVSGIQHASYVPPPADSLPECMTGLEQHISRSDSRPPLVRIALCHYQFEAIHPYRDGNGRVGRLLITLLLIKWKLLPLPVLYLSAYFEANRRQYYDLLLSVSQHGEWRQWIRFFLGGVNEQARDAIERIKRLQDLRAAWRELLVKTNAPALPMRLADALVETPIITIRDARDLLGVSFPGARKTIDKLLKLGILQQSEADGREMKFVAAGVMEIFAPNGDD
jgi:Fic family protein